VAYWPGGGDGFDSAPSTTTCQRGVSISCPNASGRVLAAEAQLEHQSQSVYDSRAMTSYAAGSTSWGSLVRAQYRPSLALGPERPVSELRRGLCATESQVTLRISSVLRSTTMGSPVSQPSATRAALAMTPRENRRRRQEQGSPAACPSAATRVRPAHCQGTRLRRAAHRQKQGTRGRMLSSEHARERPFAERRGCRLTRGSLSLSLSPMFARS
jgi:hypothetical protein